MAIDFLEKSTLMAQRNRRFFVALREDEYKQAFNQIELEKDDCSA